MAKRQEKREVDELFKDVYSWWGKTFVYVKKTRMSTWKGAVILAFVAGVAAAIVMTVSVNMQTLSRAGNETASLTMLPTQETYAPGEEFEVDVVLNTDGSDAVAVRAVIDYDINSFDFLGWDLNNSIFSLGNECLYDGRPCSITEGPSADGRLAITVAKPTPGVKTNSGLVATLKFRPKSLTSPSSPNIKFAYSSDTQTSYTDSDVILDDSKGTDILKSVLGAKIFVANEPNDPGEGETCQSFTYSEWGTCQLNGTQHRTVLSASPEGCSGGNPELEKECTPPPLTGGEPVCESYEYNEWGPCQPSNQRTRTIKSAYPPGCRGGILALVEPCTYIPPVTEEPRAEAPKISIRTEAKEKANFKSYFAYKEKIRFSGQSPEIAGGKLIISDSKGKKIGEASVDSQGSWKATLSIKKTDNISFAYYNSSGAEVFKDNKRIRIDDEKPKFTDLPGFLRKRPGEIIWWDAKDNVRISHYRYNFLGRERMKVKRKDKYFVVPANAPRGLHILRVDAYDDAGNRAKKTITILIY